MQHDGRLRKTGSRHVNFGDKQVHLVSKGGDLPLSQQICFERWMANPKHERVIKRIGSLRPYRLAIADSTPNIFI